MRYAIVDAHTMQQIGGIHTSRARAQGRADKLDSEYGAVRYVVTTILEQDETEPKLGDTSGNRTIR